MGCAQVTFLYPTEKALRSDCSHRPPQSYGQPSDLVKGTQECSGTETPISGLEPGCGTLWRPLGRGGCQTYQDKSPRCLLYDGFGSAGFGICSDFIAHAGQASERPAGPTAVSNPHCRPASGNWRNSPGMAEPGEMPALTLCSVQGLLQFWNPVPDSGWVCFPPGQRLPCSKRAGHLTSPIPGFHPPGFLSHAPFVPSAAGDMVAPHPESSLAIDGAARTVSCF